MTKPYANQPNNKPIFNEFITPVGKVVHCYHDKPQLQTTEKTNLPIMDENGIQKADFKVTLWWPNSELNTTLIPLRQLAATTRDEAWPGCTADNWFRLEPFLRDGNNPEHNTKKKEYLFNGVYLNFKTKALPTRHPDGRVSYAGAPGLIGPNNEDLFVSDMYAGCMARVSGILFGTEYSGRNFISIRLNNIQKAADGERMGGGGKPDAKSQFEPLQQAPLGGFGTTVL